MQVEKHLQSNRKFFQTIPDFHPYHMKKIDFCLQHSLSLHFGSDSWQYNHGITLLKIKKELANKPLKPKPFVETRETLSLPTTSVIKILIQKGEL